MRRSPIMKKILRSIRSFNCEYAVSVFPLDSLSIFVRLLLQKPVGVWFLPLVHFPLTSRKDSLRPDSSYFILMFVLRNLSWNFPDSDHIVCVTREKSAAICTPCKRDATWIGTLCLEVWKVLGQVCNKALTLQILQIMRSFMFWAFLTQILMDCWVAAQSQYLVGLKQSALMISPGSRE